MIFLTAMAEAADRARLIEMGAAGFIDKPFDPGRLAAADGRDDDAIALYRRAITLDPRMHDAHSNLGNHLAAESAFREASLRDPNTSEWQMFMAQAGFYPAEAIVLWQHMAQAGGEGPKQWQSTHPSDQTRIERLHANLPSAMREFEAARAAGKDPSCEPPPDEWINPEALP